MLVIPTEELEALRRPRPMEEAAPPPPIDRPGERRRRAGPILVGVALLLLVGGGAAAAFFLLGDGGGLAVTSPSPSATAIVTAEPTVEETPEATPEPTAAPTPSRDLATPTPEPTPEVGDAFAFYEVSVAPAGYTVFQLDPQGTATQSRVVSFAGYSFARAEPFEAADGDVFWITADGDLEGWAYRYPDSGEFRIRAVFLNPAGERRSVYLEQDDLTEVPEATPAP